MTVDPQRYRPLNKQPLGSGPVVYWMSRDQRVNDNWALLYAAELAERHQVPLAVVFTLSPKFLGASLRHYSFMFQGLAEVEQALASKNISFWVLTGEPTQTLPEFVKTQKIGALITDFSPVKIGRQWREKLAECVKISMSEVDAHNIVPCWVTSPKLEFSARTIRPKIHKLVPHFLSIFPPLPTITVTWPSTNRPTDWTELLSDFKPNHQIKPITWCLPGEVAAVKALEAFIEHKLEKYAITRNDPSLDGQSNLSPYLHFGQLAAQRIALEIEKRQLPTLVTEAFWEEFIVRKELSDNFCLYNPEYDSVKGFPAWAQKSLAAHAQDLRPTLYTLEELETAQTHDELWNAAQSEMVKHGKMHGYMRMYWAKKILEWTVSPDIALEWAIYLNDTYELDGRDPNGYAGIAWSIGGTHDRPWFDREIFGSIRYMNYNGAQRKFKIANYIEYVKNV